MGNINIKQPAMDLLPPRFSTPGEDNRDMSLFSPLETEFGVLSRSELFRAGFAGPGLSLQSSLRPDATGTTRITASLSELLPQRTSGAAPPFAVALTTTSPVPPAAALARGSLQMSSSGELSAIASLVQVRSSSEPSAQQQQQQQQQHALPPSSLFVSLRHGSSARDQPLPTSTPLPAAATPAARADPEPPLNPRPAAPAPSTLHAELGGRYSSASSAWSAGGAMGAGAPFPIRLFAIGQHGSSGRLTGGLELSGGLHSFLAKALGAPAAAAQAAAAQAAAQAAGAAAGALPACPPSPPLALAAAVSFTSSHPAYELALGIDSARAEAVAGYTHSMVVRRQVWNPLEAAHVKGIYQYLDLGLEARRSLLPPFPSTLGLVGAWQLNRHLLLKARLGSSGGAVSAAVRSWTDPCVTLCCTVAAGGGGGGALAFGCSLSLNQGAGRQGSSSVIAAAEEQQHLQAATPSLLMPAKPELNMARQEASW